MKPTSSLSWFLDVRPCILLVFVGGILGRNRRNCIFYLEENRIPLKPADILLMRSTHWNNPSVDVNASRFFLV